ncbi:hypothetical protein [Variovorax sp. GT1P44]|uniref:hypothetical protein n=1 Tax=Variovorax sp. GT1P44 TaxID=3443742 RepID=UPI003F44C023
MFEVTDEVRALAKVEFGQGPPSAAFRRLAERLDLQRPDLAWVASEVFDNMRVTDLQAIWQWDLAQEGEGHSDKELDSLLSHLCIRMRPALPS